MLIQALPSFQVQASTSVQIDTSTRGRPIPYKIIGPALSQPVTGMFALDACASVSLPDGTYTVTVGTLNTAATSIVSTPQVLVSWGTILPSAQSPARPSINGNFLIVRLLSNDLT